jgi:hypothetical protein
MADDMPVRLRLPDEAACLQQRPQLEAARQPPRAEGAPPRTLGRTLSSRQFWDLMERWHIPEATALELIEFSREARRSGQAAPLQIHDPPAEDHVLSAGD